MAKTKWRAKNGINYPRPGRPKTGPGSEDEVRREEGDTFEDLSAEQAGEFLAHGDIEPWSEPSSVIVDAPAPDAPKVP